MAKNTFFLKLYKKTSDDVSTQLWLFSGLERVMAGKEALKTWGVTLQANLSLGRVLY